MLVVDTQITSSGWSWQAVAERRDEQRYGATPKSAPVSGGRHSATMCIWSSNDRRHGCLVTSSIAVRPRRPRLSSRALLAICGLALVFVSWPARATVVAVAANFLQPLRAILSTYEAPDDEPVELVAGASGLLYAQIEQGAPYAAFLSADQHKPRALLRSGHAVAGSRFTYAHGALVLWSADSALVDDAGVVLSRGPYRKLALANARVAPYGRAAQQVLAALGLVERTAAHLVFGENVNQAYRFVATGNAQLGLIARSQVYRNGQLTRGSAWPVPADLHAPIRQDAVLLDAEDHAARALLAYLQSPAGRRLIARHGYIAP